MRPAFTLHRRLLPLLRGLRALLVLALVLNLTGTAYAFEEVVEEAVHLSTQGHPAHAAEHPEGEPEQGSEHDCTGTVHHCGCCPSVTASLDAWPALPSGPVIAQAVLPELQARAPAGIRRRVERPPIA